MVGSNIDDGLLVPKSFMTIIVMWHVMLMYVRQQQC